PLVRVSDNIVACTFPGAGGKCPDTQYWYCSLIQSRFFCHWSAVVIGISFAPSYRTKGSGSMGVERMLAKSGGNSPVRCNQSFQTLSCTLIRRVLALNN